MPTDGVGMDNLDPITTVDYLVGVQVEEDGVQVSGKVTTGDLVTQIAAMPEFSEGLASSVSAAQNAATTAVTAQAGAEQALAQAKAAATISVASWAELAAVTPTAIGQMARVSADDAGTHTGRTAASPGADVAGVANTGIYGAYAVTAGAWRRDGALTTAGVASNAETAAGVVADKDVVPTGLKYTLDERFGALAVSPLPGETGLPLAFTDPVTRRVSAKMEADGTWTFYAVNLPAGAVSYGTLDASLQSAMPNSTSPESGVMWCLTDPVTRRMAIAVGYDGRTSVYSPVFGADAVAVSALQQEVKRQALPQRADVAPVRPDIWRQRAGEVGVETAILDGAMFTPFPDRPVRLLRGANNTGAPVAIRAASGLQIIGRQYIGAYDPGAWPSITYRGYIYAAAIVTPVGTFAPGDYYRFDGSTAGTWNGHPLNNGDCLVYGSDAAWHVQVSPGSGTTRGHKSFWLSSAGGWYDGKQLAANDRVMFVSLETLGGNPFLPARWYRGNTADLGRADLWWRGEFAPASGYPASPVHGDVYQASAAGTAGGVTFALGDYAIYEAGAWSRVENGTIRTYAVGEAITLPCAALASEWEVRRADKAAGASRLAVRLSCQVQALPKRSGDDIILMSDSMFGNGGVGTQILAALPGRVGSVRANGGSNSRQVLGMMEYAIATGDLDLTKLVIAWHGQNNQPGSLITDLSMAQIMECSLRMADLVGARDGKILFLSILGQRAHGWDGTRIICPQHEDQVAGTSALAALRRWYDRTFSGQVVHPLDILLAAAGDTLDPTHPVDPATPGSALMTERQVAAKWGIVPRSLFGNADLVGVPLTSLVYKGTWTGAALPTGGASGDYYLRIDAAGSGCGALLVNESGTWAERQIDITHLGTAGGAAMATGGAGSSLGAGYSVVAVHPGVAGFILQNNI